MRLVTLEYDFSTLFKLTIVSFFKERVSLIAV